MRESARPRRRLQNATQGATSQAGAEGLRFGLRQRVLHAQVGEARRQRRHRVCGRYSERNAAHAQRSAKNGHLTNIKPVLATQVDPKLPDQGIDLVLLVDVYHELSNPEEVLKAIRKSLKPEGRMVLAEFRLEDPNVPIKLLHKMSKEQILKEVLPAGFRLAEQFDELPWQHLMFFEPAADP